MTKVIYSNGTHNEMNKGIPQDLLNTADFWYLLSKDTGDRGSCVMGAGLDFKYKGEQYDMRPQSPWQGENSWMKHIKYIKRLLKGLGATEVMYREGIID